MNNPSFTSLLLTTRSPQPSLSQESYNGVLNALLDAGVDGGGPDGWEGEHAVELAAAKGYMGVCARLVSNGEGGKVLRLESGMTALHTACERGDLSLIKMLCGMVRERHGDEGVLKAMRLGSVTAEEVEAKKRSEEDEDEGEKMLSEKMRARLQAKRKSKGVEKLKVYEEWPVHFCARGGQVRGE